jgi:fatty acid desaturase
MFFLMSRNFFRSDHDAGKPAWIEWIVVGILLAIGASGLLGGGGSIVPVLATVCGLAFGFFLVVVKLGKLRPTESS